MPTCPFCQNTISEELDRFGGSCPSCFNEVPGEEAATDPGIQETTGQAAPDEKKGGGLGPMLGLVVLLLGGGAFYALGPGAAPPEQPQVTGPDDEADFYSIDLDELETTSVIPTVAGREVAPPTGQAAKAGPSGGSSGATTSSGSGTRSGSGSASLGGGSSPPPSEQAPAETSEERKPATTAEKSSGSSASAGVSVRRRSSGGVALSEPAEIAAMVRDAMSRYSDQFGQCHTKKLNQDESFGGTWELSLVVNTDGSASRIRVTPKDDTVSDPEFEGCMVSKVEKWRFKTTTEAMAFKKRYTFDGR